MIIMTIATVRMITNAVQLCKLTYAVFKFLKTFGSSKPIFGKKRRQQQLKFIIMDIIL